MLLVWAMWGVAAVLLAWVLTQVRTMASQSFGLPHWGMSFPLAAFTGLSLTLSQDVGGGWLELPALVLLALTTLVILKLTRHTWRGLHMGHLLVPEK
jgi:tellurite resistance protein